MRASWIERKKYYHHEVFSSRAQKVIDYRSDSTDTGVHGVTGNLPYVDLECYSTCTIKPRLTDSLTVVGKYGGTYHPA